MKKVTLKNYEIESILNNINSGDSILNTLDKLNWGLLWKVKKNVNALIPLAQELDAMRNKLQQSYMGDEKSYDDFDEDGNLVGRKIKPEFYDEFNREMNELMMAENEVEIDVVDISEIENVSSSANYFSSILFMIEETIEEN